MFQWELATPLPLLFANVAGCLRMGRPPPCERDPIEAAAAGGLIFLPSSCWPEALLQNSPQIIYTNRGEKAAFLALDGAAEPDRRPRLLCQRQPREAEGQGSLHRREHVAAEPRMKRPGSGRGGRERSSSPAPIASRWAGEAHFPAGAARGSRSAGPD